MITAIDALFDLKWALHLDYMQGRISKLEWERMNDRYEVYIEVYSKREEVNNGALYGSTK